MLKIHDWEQWQTYRTDRGAPPWIKVHRCLMRKPKWVELSDVQRGQILMLWLLAADNEGHVPDDARLLEKLCFMSDTLDLEFFVENGWVERKHSMPSRCRQGAVPETETEEETEKKVSAFEQKYPLHTGRGFVYPEEFEAVWELWPNLSAKAKGYKCWRRLLRDKQATVDELHTSCKNYAGENRNKDPRHTKHLATFLGPDMHFMDYLEGKLYESAGENGGGVREFDEDGNLIRR